MSVSTRRLVLATLLGLGAATLLPARALANANHQVRGARAVPGGAQVTVVMIPAGSYTSFHVGVTVSGNRSSTQEHGTRGTAHGPTEVKLHIPYGGIYRSGQTIRVISSWPAQGRTHYWGQNSDALVTLP